MALIQTRRGFLGGIAAAGAAGLLGTKRARAAEGKLETTTVRLPKSEAICAAPQDLAEGFLREEGFTDIRYVPAPPPLNTPEQIERGALDFGMNYAPVMLAGIDRGVPMTVLAGVLVGCFELLVTGEFHGITDLKGKSIGIQAVGSYEYWFLSVIAANIGIDPRRDIRWVTAGGKVRPKEVFTDGKIDAFLAFPPDVPGAARPAHRPIRPQQHHRPPLVAIFLLRFRRQQKLCSELPGRDPARAARHPQGDRPVRQGAGACRAAARRWRVHPELRLCAADDARCRLR